MINVTDKHNCCGCEACVQVCPKHCISFEEDAEGFRYPNVDTSLCVECKACDKVCPVVNKREAKVPLHIYAAKNAHNAIRMASSSGGVFSLMAEQIISLGGVIFGARFNKKWEVEHGGTETFEGIADSRSSKYVQSRIGKSFVEARRLLQEGRWVLFSGTSCQIAALKLFLKKEYDNLLTVDMICHGTPSPGVWRKYLETVMANARKGENSVSSPLNPLVPVRDALAVTDSVEIKSISFRDKRLGWKKYSFALTLAKATADGKQNTVSLSHIHPENPYMKAFLSNINLRPSCYRCPAKDGRSGADVTLADYWGIDREFPEYDDDRGVSLVILNTEKGANLFNSLKLEKIEVSAESSLRYNPSFYAPVSPHPNRSRFFSEVFRDDVDIISLMNGLTRTPINKRIVWKMKSIIKSAIRFIRRFFNTPFR